MGHAEGFEHVGHLVVDGVYQVHAVAEPRQPTGRDLKRVPVAIQPHEPQLRHPGKEGFGVPGHAESGVHQHRVGCFQCRTEQPDAPLEHDGGVDVGVGHEHRTKVP